MTAADEANETGRRVLEAIRAFLVNDVAPLNRLIAAPTNLSQYIAVALAVATIRWASLATGIAEATIIDELAANYAQGDSLGGSGEAGSNESSCG